MRNWLVVAIVLMALALFVPSTFAQVPSAPEGQESGRDDAAGAFTAPPPGAPGGTGREGPPSVKGRPGVPPFRKGLKVPQDPEFKAR